MMNNFSGIGRLTKDPELRYTANGLAICKFTIAIQRPTAKDGEQTADFPQITVMGKTAENCQKYLAKGRMVAVEGSFQTSSYTDRDGNKRYSAGIFANKVHFLEWGKEENHQSVAQPQQAQSYNSAPAAQQGYAREVPAPSTYDEYVEEFANDEDLPF